MLLSIITINYNDAVGLARTIESVRDQCFMGKVEFIVIDGASNDGSVDVIDAACDVIDKSVSEPDAGNTSS